jgi:XTP/dITP diphosphohydrolase
MRLVVATGNPHKLVELRHALADLEVEALGRSDGPEETGATYVENARLKARFAREHGPADAWGVGEDSGIEAAVLDGAPGVHSARWADDGVGALLAALEGADDRRARYVCALVVIAPDGREVVAEGTLEGVVAAAPRGSEGFGYDPILVPEGETLTVAELGDDWKRTNSHRARAAATLARILNEARSAP